MHGSPKIASGWGCFPETAKVCLEGWHFQMRLLTSGEGEGLESESVISGQ